MIKIDFLRPCEIVHKRNFSIFNGFMEICVWSNQYDAKLVSEILQDIEKYPFIPYVDHGEIETEVILAIDKMRKAEKAGYLNPGMHAIFLVSWSKPTLYQGICQWLKWRLK